ncbi:MAG: acylphosphatase [Candidatus Omnitrophota bacterium]
MQKCYHIFYTGQVQGVGFRYTTRALALKHNVCGWVKNCPGGGVQLYIHGESKILEAFLNDIDQEFKGYVHDTETKECTADETCTDFRIIF